MPGQLELALIVSFDAGTRTATVRLASGVPTQLTAVPVAAGIDGAGLTVGRECVVSFLEAYNSASAVVYAVLGTPGDAVGGGGGGNVDSVWAVFGGP